MKLEDAETVEARVDNVSVALDQTVLARIEVLQATPSSPDDFQAKKVFGFI